MALMQLGVPSQPKALTRARRWRRVLAAALVATGGSLLWGLSPALPQAKAAALDPSIPIFTLTTPHFRVNYPQGYERTAQIAAGFAEDAYKQLVPYMKTEASSVIELTLFDHEDTVNGLALAYMTPAVYIYLTNPDSDLLFGRHEDWLKQVITHELTHVLHFEVADGATAAINRIFGRLLFSNLFAPTFLIEGLAVHTESLFSKGAKSGRGHDGYFDMYLRGDIMEGRQVQIDQATGYYMTDFPGGDAPYVYGTFFYKYLIEAYGEDKPAAIAHAFSATPWLGIDHAVGTVIPGRNAQDIWEEMNRWLRRRAQSQLARIQQKPVTRTHAVTTTAFNHHHPDYLPDGTLVFVEGLRHAPSKLMRFKGAQPNGQPILEPIFNKSHFGDYDVSRDGKYLYYSNSRGANNFSSFDDIFRRDLSTGETVPLTEFARMANPGISPDGKRLLATVNRNGTTNLVLLDAKDGKLLKRITTLDDQTQFTAPRWSPDGKHVVMSAWKGGSRDLWLLDTTTWALTQLWKDMWLDVGPVWAPDGKHIVFVSDRDEGVYNMFAYNWAEKRLFQMSNVLTGVMEPAVSPDGKTVAFAYCRGVGFDIHTMPYDPASWTEVTLPGVDPEIVPLVYTPPAYPSGPYSPLPSFMPKFWSPIFQSNPAMLGVFTIGYDVLLTNTVFGLLGYNLFQPNLPAGQSINPADLINFAFLYQNSANLWNINGFASGGTNRIALPLANGTTGEHYQRTLSISAGVALNNLPSPLTNASFQAGDVWTFTYGARLVNNLTTGELADELLKARFILPPGRSMSLKASYKASDSSKFGYSISPEVGGMMTVGGEISHPFLGSEFTYGRLFGDWRRYMALPWRHHVLALRGTLGASVGSAGGDFYLGGARSASQAGTPDIRIASDPDDAVMFLRGYPFAGVTANSVALSTAEYRFPLVEFQRGVGTMPFFGERLSAAVYSDLGMGWSNNWLELIGVAPVGSSAAGARPNPTFDDLRWGLGGELRLHFKIANNPLNAPPVANLFRSAVPALNAFNDSAGLFRVGIAQGVLPTKDTTGNNVFQTPTFYTEFGTAF